MTKIQLNFQTRINVTMTLNYGGDDPQKWISSEKVHFTYINTVLTVFNSHLICFSLFYVKIFHLKGRKTVKNR